MSIKSNGVHLENVCIKCPSTWNPVEKLPREVSVDLLNLDLYYSCNRACVDETYTFEAGSTILDGDLSSKQLESLKQNYVLPTCQRCPIGVKCEGKIQIMSNYWGYMVENDTIYIVRCPDGYCCQDNATCHGIDSCNTNRAGTLCGICVQNWTESPFSTACIPAEACDTNLVLSLYILAVIGYSLALITLSVTKDKIIFVFKEGYRNIRKILEKDNKKCITCSLINTVNNSSKRIKETEHHKGNRKDVSSEKDRNEDSDQDSNVDGMKYMQILFYYVQDSRLFQVKLPSENVDDESWIIKFLQFSPEVIVDLYGKVSNLCFNQVTTAITKILFKSLFGPCVTLFLYIIFLLQNRLSLYLRKDSTFWKSLKVFLMRAFILAVLFSYQQVAIGAFTLVQCVKVEDRKVLYIQGEILCDTWWQTAIEIYIWLSVIPTFLTLCHAAFYVQSKEMSIKIFILVYLFPLPVTIIYHMARSVEVFRSKRSEKIKLEKIQSCRDIEDVLLQSSSKTVISEQLQIRKPEKSTFDQIKRFGLFDLESKSRMQSKASTDTLGQIC